MAVSLAVKFAITAAALGCATRKDLARAFAKADPATSFDLDRSYKWLQGRAQPRDPKLYREWIDLLGIDRTREWLLDCTSDQFLTVVSLKRQVGPERLWQQAMDFLGEDVPDQASPMGLRRQLEGVFAAYSWAWSPYRHGRIIRGTLVVTQSRRVGRPDVVYSETLQGDLTRMRGTTYDSGQSLFLNLLHEDGELPLFFSMVRPNPPTSVMMGHLAGAALMGPSRPPSITRIIMLRVPASVSLVESTNRYLEPDEQVVPDLVRLGLDPAQPDELENEIQAFLRGAPAGGVDQVTAEIYGRIIELLDPLWIEPPQPAERGALNS
ncbi:MAG TPA: hypothetical protein VHL31_15665 [Geminicoccus sp.]|jgi:hypothetical protein|uniref:hypothetical protein n=1 Tax=Geminicoccus sp. TaxID=2024832 RepID=UPI002E349446|nr:hypothetical protein [Geminicoccus sp.]HEX2527720.1 hypothetical protein [Geminicoccus sp.]